MHLKSICCEIIKTCPLSCIHCSANSNINAKEYIPFSDIVNIINHPDNNKLETFFISGGEPLLHPHIYKIIQLLKKKNIKTIIYSSGCLPKNSDIGAIDIETFNKLEKEGVDSIVFSLYSLKHDIHNEVTKTKNSLTILKDTLLNAQRSLKNTKIELSFIPLQKSFNEIGEIIDFSKKNNISKLNILKLIHQGRAKYSGIVNLTEEEEKTFVQLLQRKNKDIILNIEISKLYDCDNYNYLQKSPYTAGKDEIFITSHQDILEGRRFRV